MLGDDLVFAVEDQREIQPGVVAMDAVFFRMQKPFPNLGGMQECLGRNAAYMQAWVNLHFNREAEIPGTFVVRTAKY